MYCGCGLQKSSAASPAPRENHEPIFIFYERVGQGAAIAKLAAFPASRR